MIAYRITKDVYAAPAKVLGAEGAGKAGGRWNRKGQPLVYASSSLSLAMLETLARVRLDGLPSNLVFVALDIPDDLAEKRIHVTDLPPDWATPDHPACVTIGGSWIDSNETPILRAPSAVNQYEANIFVNPSHSHSARIGVSAPTPVRYDPRTEALFR